MSKYVVIGLSGIKLQSSLYNSLLINQPKLYITTTVCNSSIFRKFINSFRIAYNRPNPKLVGTDQNGNRYYEAEPNKYSEHRFRSKLPQRFFMLPGQSNVDERYLNVDMDMDTLPTEWRSWLRHRRQIVPDQTEIDRNLQFKNRRIARGQELEAKYDKERAQMVDDGLIQEKPLPSESDSEFKSFPTYEIYESNPGSVREARGEDSVNTPLDKKK